MGIGFGTWIWDLGLGLGLDNICILMHVGCVFEKIMSKLPSVSLVVPLACYTLLSLKKVRRPVELICASIFSITIVKNREFHNLTQDSQKV